MNEMIDRWLSVKEICTYLDVSNDTVYRWIEKYEMPIHQFGHLFKFKIYEVDAWVNVVRATVRNYYLQYSDEVKGIQFRGRYFYVPEGSEDKLRDMFKEFYQGRIFIEPMVQRFTLMIGVNVEATSIIDLKNRWDLCSVKESRCNSIGRF